MAILGIDHVVVIGEALATLTARFQSLGFRVTPGGTYTDSKSRNALIPFQDGSYIELITFEEDERSGRQAKLLTRGDRMIEYVLTSNGYRDRSSASPPAPVGCGSR